jgi:hypothetical protein
VTATLFFPNGLVNIQTVQHVSTSNKYAKNLFFFLTLGSSGIMFANGELTPYEEKKKKTNIKQRGFMEDGGLIMGLLEL